MNNKEFDLEKFVDMFDTAMDSNNPTVQKCFNNLLMVVALAHAEDKEKHIGPLRKLVDEIKDLQNRMSYIEHSLVEHSTSKKYYERGGTNTVPIWTTTTTDGNGYVPPYSGATSTYTLH
jgi:hypothetical protein